MWYRLKPRFYWGLCASAALTVISAGLIGFAVEHQRWWLAILGVTSVLMNAIVVGRGFSIMRSLLEMMATDLLEQGTPTLPSARPSRLTVNHYWDGRC
jgi:hypothetical protein